MLYVKYLLFWVFFSCLATSCSVIDSSDFSSRIPLTVHVRLPAVIADHPVRYGHFLRKVQNIRIKLERENEPELVSVYPSGNWESLTVLVPFGRTSAKCKLKLEVWDLRADGYLRNYAVMKGERSVEIPAESKALEISVSLNLQISAENYD